MAYGTGARAVLALVLAFAVLGRGSSLKYHGRKVGLPPVWAPRAEQQETSEFEGERISPLPYKGKYTPYPLKTIAALCKYRDELNADGVAELLSFETSLNPSSPDWDEYEDTGYASPDGTVEASSQPEDEEYEPTMEDFFTEKIVNWLCNITVEDCADAGLDLTDLESATTLSNNDGIYKTPTTYKGETCSARIPELGGEPDQSRAFPSYYVYGEEVTEKKPLGEVYDLTEFLVAKSSFNMILLEGESYDTVEERQVALGEALSEEFGEFQLVGASPGKMSCGSAEMPYTFSLFMDAYPILLGLLQMRTAFGVQSTPGYSNDEMTIEQSAAISTQYEKSMKQIASVLQGFDASLVISLLSSESLQILPLFLEYSTKVSQGVSSYDALKGMEASIDAMFNKVTLCALMNDNTKYRVAMDMVDSWLYRMVKGFSGFREKKNHYMKHYLNDESTGDTAASGSPCDAVEIEVQGMDEEGNIESNMVTVNGEGFGSAKKCSSRARLRDIADYAKADASVRELFDEFNKTIQGQWTPEYFGVMEDLCLGKKMLIVKGRSRKFKAIAGAYVQGTKVCVMHDPEQMANLREEDSQGGSTTTVAAPTTTTATTTTTTANATASPSPSPSAASSTSENAACFPSDAFAQLQDGAYVSMDALKVGDVVRVAQDEYSPVILFTHADEAIESVFVRLQTASGHALELSPTHYVYANNRLVPASHVKEGDLLLLADADVPSSSVTSATEVSKRGLFNPQTIHGDIVVNGIVASTFTTAIPIPMGRSLLWPLSMLHKTCGVVLPRLSEMFASGAPTIAKLLPDGPASYEL